MQKVIKQITVNSLFIKIIIIKFEFKLQSFSSITIYYFKSTFNTKNLQNPSNFTLIMQVLAHPNYSTPLTNPTTQHSSLKHNSQQQQSIIDWIHQKYSSKYTHCKQVNKLEDLYTGVALAQIVSDNINEQQDDLKEMFLNQIQIVESNISVNNNPNSENFRKAVKNMNCVVDMVKMLVDKALSYVKKDNSNKEIVEICKFAHKNIQKISGQSLIGNKIKLKSFMMQIIMILPQIKILQASSSLHTTKNQYQSNHPQDKTVKASKYYQPNLNNEYNVSRFSTSKQKSSSKNRHTNENFYSNIQQLSSIVQIVPKPAASKIINHQKPPLARKNSSIKKQVNKQNYQTLEVKNFNSNPNPKVSHSTISTAKKQRLSQHNSRVINQRQSIQNCQQNQHQFEIVQKPQNELSQTQLIELQNRIQKLLQWMEQKFPQMNLQKLTEPHLLLGELINCVLAQNKRLNPNQNIIKPSHFDLGPYSVYKKAINILVDIQRLNKTNLIQFMKQLDQGQVKEGIFWGLVQDLYNMSNNKLGSQWNSITMRTIQKEKQRSKSKQQRKTTQKTQSDYERLSTQFNINDQNINRQNIKNQSVGQLLKNSSTQKLNSKPNQLKIYPEYDQNIIKQTQIWLQQQMGMSHPLNKSKQQPFMIHDIKGKLNNKEALNERMKQTFQNPLLNGTMFSKILQRLKIGTAKGVIVPTSSKQLQSNISTIKNQLLKRGYECARKIDLFKATYNFYIGLLSQIKTMYESKQNLNKAIMNQQKRDKKIRDNQKINLILEEEYKAIERWLQEDYKIRLEQNITFRQAFNHQSMMPATHRGQNTRRFIPLSLIKQIVESIIKINLLKQTTQKIRKTNYQKLMDYFRSIGFVHYANINVTDFIDQNISGISEDKFKRSQGIRWMILRDLKLIKGYKR